MTTQNVTKQLSRSARAARKKKEEFEKLRDDHREACMKIETLSMHISAFEAMQQAQATMSLTFTTVDKNAHQWASLSDRQKAVINDRMQTPNQKVFYMKNSVEYMPRDVDLKVTIRVGVDSNDILDSFYQIMQSIHKEKHRIQSWRANPSYITFNPNSTNWRHDDYGPQVCRVEE